MSTSNIDLPLLLNADPSWWSAQRHHFANFEFDISIFFILKFTEMHQYYKMRYYSKRSYQKTGIYVVLMTRLLVDISYVHFSDTTANKTFVGDELVEILRDRLRSCQAAGASVLQGEFTGDRYPLTEHYCDAIMGTVASQITSLTFVYTTVYPDADQSKHQSSASLAFVWGIHRGPVNSLHKWPATRKMFPFDDVIMKPVLHKWGTRCHAIISSCMHMMLWPRRYPLLH